MAAARGAYSEDEIKEILAKVEAIPCFEKEKIFNFKVSALNIVANLSCSSSFEAATKFGFLLLHVGMASNTRSDCSPLEIVCECLETEEILLYSLSIGNDNTPHVSLVKIQTPALNDSCCDDMFDM